MKTSFVFALVLAASQPAIATSLHPCTPTVKAVDTHITCREGDLTYSITVETLMSPVKEICQGANYFEYKTATIEEQDFEGNVFEEFQVVDGQFNYTLSPLGDATFSSPSLKLDLTKCVTPIHGDFGN